MPPFIFILITRHHKYETKILYTVNGETTFQKDFFILQLHSGGKQDRSQKSEGDKI
jgi:hypothetical protein